ncbi:arsenic transporter [Massilia horti]|nr:arsenic transporter [Massilia horti]
MYSPHFIWLVAALSVAGILAKPFNLPEAVWVVVGAVVLCLSGQLTWRAALAAAGQGEEVYFFLVGMMLIAELARASGLFDYIAALAVRAAKGSSRRLFCLVYLVGIAVTAFMSNDTAAVVLTPAVLAAGRKAGLGKPMPHLYACALVANAASFLLLISNPANLVVYDGRMPSLASWIGHFGPASCMAIAATFAALYWSRRKELREPVSRDVPVPRLASEGKLVAIGIAVMAVLLLVASALGRSLGWPACIAGAGVLVVVALHKPGLAWPVLRGISWNILPLVAGLFVLVAGLSKTGMTQMLAHWLDELLIKSPVAGIWMSGIVIALAVNLANNLPVAFFAGAVLGLVHASPQLAGSVLVGIDLGPSLSVPGSLSTVLWLAALQQEGIKVGRLQFLRVGVQVMPVAVLLTLFVLASWSMPGR